MCPPHPQTVAVTPVVTVLKGTLGKKELGEYLSDFQEVKVA